jgi:hypothetical protein
MSGVFGSDGKQVPQGFKNLPHFAELQQAASCALTTPTAATVVTDADCWGAGDQSPTNALGGPLVSATAGTITITKAGNYEIEYGQSDLTVVNAQVITLQIFGGSAGTTALGGISKSTQLTAAPLVMAGKCFAACAVGDIITLKVIASTGNYTSAAGFLLVKEI